MRAKKIFVISDLHLGGADGFQMCSDQKSLAEFIDWVAARAAADRDADYNLVLAGDIIDFLAEREWLSFTHSEDDALKKIESVFKNFRPVFSALRNFVESKSTLTVLLGNHDVEMSLPRVRRRLLDELGWGRVEFIYDNEAFVAGDVIIEHGNRYDSWNAIDHDSLRQIRSLLSRHQELDGILLETPGSVFVTTVMNDLKSKYAFIDLFKPETLAVALLLSTLEPKKIFSFEGAKNLLMEGLFKSISLVKPAVYGQFVNRYDGATNMPTRRTLMAGETDDAAAAEKRRFEELLVEIGYDPEAIAALSAAEAGGTQMSGELDAADAGAESWGDYAFRSLRSFSGRINSALAREERDERAAEIKLNRIFKAFKYLRSTEKADDENGYVKAARHLSKDFRLVVFGHTHKALKKRLGDGGETAPVYLNSGTWADVILTPDGLLDEDAPGGEFAGFIGDLTSGDAARIARWRKSRGSFVEIDLDAEQKLAAANVYFFEGRDRAPTLID